MKSRTLFLLLLMLLVPLVAHAQTTVRVEWDPNTETDIAGYTVHIGLSSRTYTTTQDVGKVTLSPSITLPLQGTKYYLAVSAYNTAGVRSDFSNELSLTTASPVPVPVPVVCTFALSGPPSVGAGGGSGALSIQASDPTCAWTLSSSQSWLTVSPQSGSGSLMSAYVAQQNTSTLARSAVVTGPSSSWTLSQDGAIPPPPAPCTIAVPAVTVTTYNNKVSLGGKGRIEFTLRWTNPTVLGSTVAIADRRFVRVEAWLQSTPTGGTVLPFIPVGTFDASPVAALYYSAPSIGTYYVNVRAVDDKGCEGRTGSARQVKVN